MPQHRFWLGIVASVGWLPIGAVADTVVSVNVDLSTPAVLPRPPSEVVLALPSPVGSAAFSVTTTNSGIAGQFTVTADTGHVPLPVTLSLCQTDPSSGTCLTPAAQTAAITLANGQTPTFTVVVSALASIPLDATFHRVYVTFTDANGAVVGRNSVAIQNASYGRQIYIDHGGTYSGNWTNDDWQTGAFGAGGNAVCIATTEPVTLENCFIRSTKEFVRSCADGINLTIRNCHAYGLDPGVAGQTRSFFVFAPKIGSLTMEHNYLEGMAWGAALWSGSNDARWTPGGGIAIRYNKVRNLDGLASDGQGGRITNVNPNANHNGFISIARLDLVNGAEIAWNEVVNLPYVSATADLVDLWASPGTPSSPVKIHDNYFHGEYAPIPENGNGLDPANCQPGVPTCYNTYVAGVISLDGSASDTAQSATSYLKIYQNQLVNTWGNIILGSGHDNEAYGNRVVSTGRLPDGTWVAPAYGAGLSVYDSYGTGPSVFYNNSAHDNVVGFVVERVSQTDPTVYLPPPIRSDYAFERLGCTGADAGKCFNNVSLPDPITFATEANELALWQQKLAANGIAAGPRLPADCLFNWAEANFASLFSPSGAQTQAWSPYVYRYYEATKAYLGISATDNHIYYISPDTGGRLIDVGDAAQWLVAAKCQ